MSSYIVASGPTPVLNRSDFENVFGAPQLPLDEKGLLRAVEFVALKGTQFTIIEEITSHILQVKTQDYPESPLFIDRRFIEEDTPEQTKQLPPKDQILSRLQSAVGQRYIWGGNWGEGITKITELYGGDSDPCRILKGVDCSGLLYEATDGFTPRNTKELMQFGVTVDSLEDVKPLDIVVWQGHVIIALGNGKSIESTYNQGVIISTLTERIPKTKYVIRRFLDEQ